MKTRKRADTATLAPRAKMILEYDEVVIGSNLTAVLYAFNNKLPIFYSRPERPFRFDHVPLDLDLTCVGMENKTQLLRTHDEDIKVGQPTEILWERLLFLISLAGRAPLSTLCESLRYNGTALICSNEYSKIGEIRFEKAHYFGNEECPGLIDEKTLANPSYICYDWIAFNRGGKHEVDLIETPEDCLMAIPLRVIQNIIILELLSSAERQARNRRTHEPPSLRSRLQPLKKKLYSKIYHRLVWDTIDF